MARIDSLLSIVAQQGADELRLGTDREPRMLAAGAPKRLAIPATPEETLRELLGELLTPERERLMREHGRAELVYEAVGVGRFQVRFAVGAGGGFEVLFRRDAARSVAASRDRNHAPAVAVAHRPAPALASPAPPAAPPPPAEVAPPVPAEPPAAPADAMSASLLGLVANAAALRASDLHIDDGAPAVVRVDGALRRLGDEPVDLAAALALGPDREARIARGGSLDLGVEAPGVGRVRVHVFRTASGLAASVRLLPEAAPALASLHLPVAVDDLVELPHGLVLVCGASGSGKSTTLAALAQEALRRRSIVLVTLEDPIEYALSAAATSLVRRRQVGQDVPDFASGLRDALREDPDVLLVGEMRDPETIGLALTAAETGHLVLASMHSRSAASAVERIVDTYPPARQGQIRVQLADALQAVIVQRLLPRARGSGRLPAVEVLRVTHAVESMIREAKTSQIASAIQSGRREGMISLERSLADRVQAGEVRPEDARTAANDPASLAMYLAK